MADDTSARLDLPYLAAGQLQKHVTLNEALTRLDALVQTAVLSRTVAAQPTNPADGDLYIRPADATGTDWSTRAEGDLLRAETGAWSVVAVPDGLIAAVLDTGEIVVRLQDGWQGVTQDLDVVQNLIRLGINTAADATNPFAAKLNKALWTALETSEAGDGDLRMTFNKQAASDVLSLLFQSAYGGRAELGLIGDDDFRLKVSADGETWNGALGVDAATGRVTFERGATRSQTTHMIASGSYAVPNWARRLEVTVVGGGGGGGSGAAGASGTSRFGGGGGGAGGIASASWNTADLSATLQIVVALSGGGGGGVASGSGGSGGAGGTSTVANAGLVLLRGAGGRPGLGGTATSGMGGAGGLGSPPANGGGNAAADAAGSVGGSQTRPDGSGGGGAGGGLDIANTASAGGAGGAGGIAGPVATGGAGGVSSAGGPGNPSPSPTLQWAGGGGGGGGANASGAGHAGGAGAEGGGGGGGGGAGVTGSGSGGSGGRGLVRITAIG